MTLRTDDYQGLRELRAALSVEDQRESERLAVEVVLEEFPHWDLVAANENGFVARREIISKNQPYPRVLYAHGPNAGTVARRVRYHESNLAREQQQRPPRRPTKESDTSD